MIAAPPFIVTQRSCAYSPPPIQLLTLWVSRSKFFFSKLLPGLQSSSL